MQIVIGMEFIKWVVMPYRYILTIDRAGKFDRILVKKANLVWRSLFLGKLEEALNTGLMRQLKVVSRIFSHFENNSFVSKNNDEKNSSYSI